MKHLGTEILETTRLQLRPFESSDAKAMFENWASDPEVTKYLSWPTHETLGISEAVTQDWISHYPEENFYQWAIVPKNLGQPIGSIAAVRVDDRLEKVEIGYCIGKHWWHQGITSEALQAVIVFFLKEVGVNRVEACYDSRNPHSGRVMEKCGMRYEGMQRQAGRNNQGLCDMCWYGILAQDMQSDEQK